MEIAFILIIFIGMYKNANWGSYCNASEIL